MSPSLSSALNAKAKSKREGPRGARYSDVYVSFVPSAVQIEPSDANQIDHK